MSTDPLPSAPPSSVPLFIVGTERSGSNLLRVILNSHPNIVIPHPPHIMRYFAPLEARYGDLSDPRNFRRLVDDVLTLVKAHIHPWPWVPKADDIIRRSVHHPSVALSAGLVKRFTRHALVLQ